MIFRNASPAIRVIALTLNAWLILMTSGTVLVFASEGLSALPCSLQWRYRHPY